MKIISWNVNGIRAAIKKGFYDFVKKENPEIICLQETKAHPDQVDMELHDYEHHYWNSAEKKGYSGTAIFSKVKPKSVLYGIGIEEHDKEGRIISVEYEDFFLVNAYIPNSKRELLRLEYRQRWDADFLSFLNKLEESKPVILCGDLNVAHKDIDLKNPRPNYNKSPGFTQTEIDGFENFLKAGFVDSFREFTKEAGHYTWWSYMFKARDRDIGWRIDYFLVSKSLMAKVEKSYILKAVLGSDHCPVSLELKK
jgi:exodeoxyribonuclease III